MSLCRTLCVLIGLSAGLPPPATAGESRRAGKPQVKVPGLSGLYVQRAVLGAGQRLAAQPCRGLLSEYANDADGQSLAARLDARGVTLEQHLGTIAFVDGSADEVCRTGQAFAGMVRAGDARVYVCPSRFLDLARSHPVNAEVIVIHEVLHTLGLGENPPTSQEITARVVSRCVDGRD
jgi:hypothetical protein